VKKSSVKSSKRWGSPRRRRGGRRRGRRTAASRSRTCRLRGPPRRSRRVCAGAGCRGARGEDLHLQRAVAEHRREPAAAGAGSRAIASAAATWRIASKTGTSDIGLLRAGESTRAAAARPTRRGGRARHRGAPNRHPEAHLRAADRRSAREARGTAGFPACARRGMRVARSTRGGPSRERAMAERERCPMCDAGDLTQVTGQLERPERRSSTTVSSCEVCGYARFAPAVGVHWRSEPAAAAPARRAA